jgi:hypothetical protein
MQVTGFAVGLRKGFQALCRFIVDGGVSMEKEKPLETDHLQRG